jgi:four helix bundle protein
LALNIWEGCRRRGKAKTHHFEIPRGSAAEMVTLVELVALPGAEAQKEQLRRVDRMLERMGG